MNEAAETTEVQETEVKEVIEEVQVLDPIGMALGEVEIPEKGEETTPPVVEEKTGEETPVEETVTPTEEKEPEAIIEPNAEMLALQEKVKGLEAGIVAERQKRQEAQKTAEKKPFDWTKPDESIEHVKTELRQENLNNFVNMSEAQCLARNEDYLEKRGVLLDMIEKDPSIYQDMLKHPDPAQRGYELASQKMFFEEVGSDPKTYREKVEAEVRAKIEAEAEQKTEDKKAIVDNLPPQSMSLGDKSTPVIVQKKPLDRLFPDSRPGG